MEGSRPRKKMNIDERSRQIRQKITAAGYSLGPVLSEEEVAAFEGRYNFKLPEGYRRFLMEIGNGGDGPPCYGFARLGELALDMNAEERRIWHDLKLLAQEFPFTQA
jgi:hypothetical protein